MYTTQDVLLLEYMYIPNHHARHHRSPEAVGRERHTKLVNDPVVALTQGVRSAKVDALEVMNVLNWCGRSVLRSLWNGVKWQ